MGFFSSEKKVIESPTKDFMGEHLYHLDGIGVNLFVYDKCVVIDRTQGGLFNLGNRTYKIIPIKNILAVQVKSTGVTTGFLEFATYGHENTCMKGFDRTNDENNINFASEQAVKVARDIVEFIVPKIC